MSSGASFDAGAGGLAAATLLPGLTGDALVLYVQRKRTGQERSFCEVCSWGRNSPETGKKNLRRLWPKGENPYQPLGRPGEGFLDPESNNQSPGSDLLSFFCLYKKKRLTCSTYAVASRYWLGPYRIFTFCRTEVACLPLACALLLYPVFRRGRRQHRGPPDLQSACGL